jgi:hypothetical protein
MSTARNLLAASPIRLTFVPATETVLPPHDEPVDYLRQAARAVAQQL